MTEVERIEEPEEVNYQHYGEDTIDENPSNLNLHTSRPTKSAEEETPEESPAATEETDIGDTVENDVIDDTVKNLGTDVIEDSLFDFLPGIGWLVGAGVMAAGLVEEVNKAQAAERASEQANIARKQVINPQLPPANFSGSYVAPVKTSVY